MLKAYVGIASRRGLVAITPERERAVELILDRARRLNFEDAVCWWAYLTEDEAAEIVRRLDCGELISALYALNQQATQLGRILPSDPSHGVAGSRLPDTPVATH